MMPDLPIDLPGNPLSEQLIWVAAWAGIDPAPLLAKETEIAEVFNKGSRACVKKLKECLPEAPWHWPAYLAMIDSVMLRDSKRRTADDARFFSRDELTDMAEYVCGKLRSRNMALYRLGQMDSIKHLRPFWQIKGECGESGTSRKTFLASDPFWAGDNMPWRCANMSCDCRVHSLSRVELKRYVEGGCDVGDEAAANLISEAK